MYIDHIASLHSPVSRFDAGSPASQATIDAIPNLCDLVFDVDQMVEPVLLPVPSMLVKHTVDTISGGTCKGNEFTFDLHHLIYYI